MYFKQCRLCIVCPLFNLNPPKPFPHASITHSTVQGVPAIILLSRQDNAGERLTTSWEVILRLLEGVMAGNDAATVSLAFQSVHLVAADLMPNLPASLLKSSLEVVSMYARQQVP